MRRLSLSCTARASRPAVAVGVSSNVRPHQNYLCAPPPKQPVCSPSGTLSLSLSLCRPRPASRRQSVATGSHRCGRKQVRPHVTKSVLSRLLDTPVVVGVCAVIIVVELTRKHGVLDGLVASVRFGGFLALFCVFISIAVKAVLREKLFTTTSMILLGFGASAAVITAFWFGTNSALMIVVPAIAGGLLVGIVSGASYRFMRKP